MDNCDSYMIALIVFYWGFMSSPRPRRIPPQKDECLNIRQHYADRHQAGEIALLSREIKKCTYGKIFHADENDEVENICEAVRDAEAKVHLNPEKAYHCILENYGGDHPLTARLTAPSGGKVHEVRKKVDKLIGAVHWYKMTITISFFFLCLHHFDYIKDIGEFVTFFSSKCL